MIKRIVFVFSILYLMFGALSAQTIRKQHDIQINIIAQKGYYKSSQTAPNTMQAFKAASDFGCVAATCEVKFTSDEQLVVVLGGTSTLRRSPDNLSLSQMQQAGFQVIMLDEYLSQFHKAFSPQKTSDEVVLQPGKAVPSKGKKGMKLLLDIRTNESKSVGAMVSLLGKFLVEQHYRKIVELGSSDLEVCRAMFQKFPDVPVVFLDGEISPREVNKKVGKIGVVYDRAVLHKHSDWARDARTLSMPLMASGVETEAEAREMVNLEVMDFLTDNPALVKAWAQGATLVKLMSFNIRMSGMPDVDGDNAWPKRRETVVSMIKEENPDVLGVQEMLPDQQQFLRKMLKAYDMVGVGRDDGHSEGECMGIFYKKDKFVLLDSGTFWLSQTPDVASIGWDAACKRTVTYVKLKENLSGKQFYYFNTHLDHVGAIARQESVKLLEKRIRELVRDTNTIFICGGDMNSTLEDPIFIPVLGGKTKKPQAEKGGMSVGRDGKVSKLVPNHMPTEKQYSLMKSCRNTAWQSDNSVTYNAYGKGNVSQIDHLFSSQKTENLIFQTLRKNYGVPYISDHYPISLIFVL